MNKMTMKKRIYTLVLAVAGAAMLAVSCGPDEVVEPADPTYPVGGVMRQTVTITGPSGQKVDMEMVLVRGGLFYRGALPTDPEALDCERPMHPVLITSDYYISAYEVTQEQYEVLTGGQNPSVFARGGDYPVENVTYEEAEVFCQTLSNRTGSTFMLPTEAQWEYAARGGHFAPQEATLYAGSNHVERVAWYGANSELMPRRVGEKAPNALGLYDMSGNVWEWCRDWYADTVYRNYVKDTAVNPYYNIEIEERVIRGGGWNGATSSCRVSDRDHYVPTERAGYVGFRVVQEI
ncbi:MAG: formylglycine-generating enzyme family protein [Bacteroidales bacterium]|nr:formylglycine-generating enzyme family protein [Bacteroidales bacterium]